MVIIFVQSNFPSVELPEIEAISTDKLAHIAVYGLLAALCYISLIHQDKFKSLYESPLLFTAIICSIYGISDEFHQYFVPNRDSEVYDWLADVAGAVIMIYLIKYYLNKKYTLFKKPKT